MIPNFVKNKQKTGCKHAPAQRNLVQIRQYGVPEPNHLFFAMGWALSYTSDRWSRVK